MKSHFIIICLFTLGLFNCKSDKNESKTTSENMSETNQETVMAKKSEIKITPISHATFIIQCDSTVIYVDPVGGSKGAFASVHRFMECIEDPAGVHIGTVVIIPVFGGIVDQSRPELFMALKIL